MLQQAVSNGSLWHWMASVFQQGDRQKPFLVIWLSTDAILPRSLEQRLEAWLLEGDESKRPPIRCGLRTSRLIASDHRAIVYTSAAQVADVLNALIRFTIVSRESLVLEQQLAKAWTTIHAHTALTHTISRRDRFRHGEVKQATEQVSQMRTMLLRLQTALEQLDPTLTSASKRLFAKLIEQASLFDRLEMLEDPIELVADHYELVNSRFIEAKNAAKEHLFETLIIVLLAAELVTNLASKFMPS